MNSNETATGPIDIIVRALNDANDRVGRLAQIVGGDDYLFGEIDRIVADGSVSPSNRLTAISRVLALRNARA